MFRELLDEPLRVAAAEGEEQPEPDFPLAALTCERMELFMEEFRSMPARQGQRHIHARTLLQQGGNPQSLANYFKCLSHVAQFLGHCVEKKWLSPEVLSSVRHVLKRDTKKSRQAEMKKIQLSRSVTTS